jgi:membrane associated rhomboid family serine protease/Tfp pilus assembly protein PilF
VKRRPIVTWVLVFLNVAVFAAMMASGVSLLMPTSAQLVAYGADWGVLTVGEHQWWRLLTSAFVHGGVWHVGMNMLGLWRIGPALEQRLGRARYLALYVGCIVVSSLASIAVHPESVAMGASGAIFGVLAALTVLRMVAAQYLVTSLLLVAFLPHIDNAGHVGGVVAGALLALALDRRVLLGGRRVALPALLVALVLSVGLVPAAIWRVSDAPIMRKQRLVEQALRVVDRDPARAVALTSEAMAVGGRDEQLLSLRGWAQLALHKLDEAEADFVAAEHLDPYTQTLALRCSVASQRGDVEKGLAVCDRALALKRLEPSLRLDALSGRASLHLQRHELKEARDDASSVIAADPTRSYPFAQRCWAESALKDPVAAEKDCAQAVRLDPESPERWVALATMQLLQGELPAAQESTEKALALAPGHELALRLRAGIALREHRDDDALALWTRAIAAAPRGGGAYNDRAWYLRVARRPQEALRDVEQALALEPKLGPAWGTRCWIEVDLGKRDQAARDCRRSLELQGESALDHGMLLFLDGKFAEARKEWEGVDPHLIEVRELAPYFEQARKRAR